MKTYTYTLSGYDAAGHYFRCSTGSEEQMFHMALAVSLEGGELLSAVREVYEEVNEIVHFIRTEIYHMGIPVAE